MAAPSPIRLVLSTCPDDASADTIARTLVDERLSACVNRLPGLRSTYRWQGAVETADEVLLLIKTSATRLDALQARLLQLHPYELPEIVAVEVAAGLDRYLDWVARSTALDGDADQPDPIGAAARPSVLRPPP